MTRLMGSDPKTHDYIDTKGRNLCDRCNQWKGSPRHQTGLMGSDPKTEAGRHYVATMFGRERSNVFSVTQTEAKMKAAIRRIEDEAAREAVEWQATDAEFQAWEARHPSARLVSPADREAEAMGRISTRLHNDMAARRWISRAETTEVTTPLVAAVLADGISLVQSLLYDAGLREDAPLDARVTSPGSNTWTLSQREDAPLDAAWREAEAALPEGWRLGVGPEWNGDHHEAWAQSTALFNDGGYDHEGEHVSADGPTPAAALLALVTQLRESQS